MSNKKKFKLCQKVEGSPYTEDLYFDALLPAIAAIHINTDLEDNEKRIHDEFTIFENIDGVWVQLDMGKCIVQYTDYVYDETGNLTMPMHEYFEWTDRNKIARLEAKLEAVEEKKKTTRLKVVNTVTGEVSPFDKDVHDIWKITDVSENIIDVLYIEINGVWVRARVDDILNAIVRDEEVVHAISATHMWMAQ